MTDYAISQVCEELKISRDRLHYLRNKLKDDVHPVKVGNRYQFSDRDVEILKEYLNLHTTYLRGLILLHTKSPFAYSVARDLRDLPFVKSVAPTFGSASLYTIVEATSPEDFFSALFKVQANPHVLQTETYQIYPQDDKYYWDAKKMLDYEENVKTQAVRLRRACVLIKVERSEDSQYVIEKLKTEIQNVPTDDETRNEEERKMQRPVFGMLLGEWDVFCLLHYVDADQLARLVMEDIQEIHGVEKTETLICVPESRWLATVLPPSNEPLMPSSRL